MAQQKVDVKMARYDNSPWGFRVHGGIDFGSPLTIQKVRSKKFHFTLLSCQFKFDLFDAKHNASLVKVVI